MVSCDSHKISYLKTHRTSYIYLGQKIAAWAQLFICRWSISQSKWLISYQHHKTTHLQLFQIVLWSKKQILAFPLELHKTVVHSGPVPHLSFSSLTNWFGGWCSSAEQRPEKTVMKDPALNVNLSGKVNRLTGIPETFWRIEYFPSSMS